MQHLSQFSSVLEKELCGCGRDRTARAYRSAVRSLLAFTGCRKLPLTKLTAPLMKNYETYLKEQGREPNTVSFYMRMLRAVYNKAVKRGLIPRPCDSPFADVFTGLAETQKRALSKEEIRRLHKLDFCGEKEHSLRDCLFLFLFSFHGRGISFVDMCHLKKSAVKGDEIHYYRRKTGGKLVVKITGPMRCIMAHFAAQTQGSPYLFPLPAGAGGRERRHCENALTRQNRLLKEVGQQSGISKPLSTHLARHSWATIAYEMVDSIATISRALGHRDEKTTRIYLASFRASDIDRLSEQISNRMGGMAV